MTDQSAPALIEERHTNRSGWTVTKELEFIHESGARLEKEQIDGQDEWHYVVQWWAITADGQRLGPFAKFAGAIHAAVPRQRMGQMELPFRMEAA